MAVYKIFAEADTTLYSAYPNQNTGLDEILEVGCRNSQVPSEVLAQGAGDDLRRSLIKFNTNEIQSLFSTISGNPWAAYLRLYLATAENLNTSYNVEIRQVSSSWVMGTGKFLDSPPSTNGATWNTPGIVNYVNGIPASGSGQWVNPSYYLTRGGGNWTATSAISQSFGYKDNKDINVDITPIVTSWYESLSKANIDINSGVLVKLSSSIENNSGSYMSLSYFSVDTHTIYPPTLEFRWDDSTYNTGSLSVISSSNSIFTIANNTGKFKNDTTSYTFRVNARDKYPVRSFTTSSIYTVNKALPIGAFWAIQDVKTEEMIIDFNGFYTKISCDGNGSYFKVYMNGLEPERYYKLLIKVRFDSSEDFVDVDTNNIFKIVR
jgi:hypothetical protein